MKKAYTELYRINEDLIGEYNKRSINHANLLESLKKVNQMIQKAAKLRGRSNSYPIPMIFI